MPDRGRKGLFSERRLPVAERYVALMNRNKMAWVGLGLGGLLVAWLAVDFFLLGGDLVSAGPLSRAHAHLDDASRCGSCHEPLASVTDGRCLGCHERVAHRFPVYGFEGHVLYASSDLDRLEVEHDAPACKTCHPEHGGREALATHVPDARCNACHEIGSFDEHPEFAFKAAGLEERNALVFTHVEHVRRILAEAELDHVDTACLYCHYADERAEHFQPVDFERHCGTCHLTGEDETDFLPVRRGDGIGVETLAQIRRSGGPGSGWAKLASSSAFEEDDGSVMKRALVHADPWILHNLRSLRQRVAPDHGLARLLRASADASGGEANRLYTEALETLRAYVGELALRPEAEIRDELAWARHALDSVERRLADPFVRLDPTVFAPPEAPEPTTDTLERVTGLVEGLTSACTKCHVVEDASIVRPSAGRRVLHRARFDHAAHLVQLACTDCHAEIPIAELAHSEEKVDPAVDRAEIWNLPGIGTCRQCHQADAAGEACVTCHAFHPNKDRRAQLARQLD